MKNKVMALLTAALVTLALGGFTAPATAATPPPGITIAQVAANLHGTALTKWQALSMAQKSATVQILSDPAYGDPSAAPALTSKYADLKVTQQTSAAVAPTSTLLAASCVGRTSWVQQNWTILGITYTSVRTTIGYTGCGGTVTAVNRCYGTYVNYVPLRSIDSNSWSTMGNGLADCWTEWTLSRPLQPTVTGIQGLRVNGYGSILYIWYV